MPDSDGRARHRGDVHFQVFRVSRPTPRRQGERAVRSAIFTGFGDGGERDRSPGGVLGLQLAVDPGVPADLLALAFCRLASDLPGNPGHEGVAGMTVPSRTTVPAATSEPVPITAPFSTTAPMPMSTSSSTVQPCTTARCPIDTPDRRASGNRNRCAGRNLPCTLLPLPTLMAPMSARRTALNHMLTPSARRTSPTTTAPGATQALGSRTGSATGDGWDYRDLGAVGDRGVNPDEPHVLVGDVDVDEAAQAALLVDDAPLMPGSSPRATRWLAPRVAPSAVTSDCA